jgi:hypothetical protein
VTRTFNQIRELNIGERGSLVLVLVLANQIA